MQKNSELRLYPRMNADLGLDPRYYIGLMFNLLLLVLEVPRDMYVEGR
jgi:hypothetical protein